MLTLYTTRPLSTQARTHLIAHDPDQERPDFTACGRWVETSWATYEVSQRLAAREVTCTQCRRQVPDA